MRSWGAGKPPSPEACPVLELHAEERPSEKMLALSLALLGQRARDVCGGPWPAPSAARCAQSLAPGVCRSKEEWFSFLATEVWSRLGVRTMRARWGVLSCSS